MRIILAEFHKLRSTYLFWLVLLVVGFISFVVFVGAMNEVNSIAVIGINPWGRIQNVGHAILSVFMLSLFSVLLISAMMFVENRASGWKLLYSFPTTRTRIFYSKLIVLLAIVLLTIFLVGLLTVLTGYLLDALRPEYEFRYYAVGWVAFGSGLLHSFIAVLGVIGIHFFLSLQFKNFLVSTAIGIVGFIMGLILGAFNTPKALFCPYSYPLIFKDFDMFRTNNIGIESWGWLTNVELFSLIWFIFFILLAYVLELKKNIV